MIAGHLNNLKLATLPDTLYSILSSAELSLNALQNQADGRYQMEGEQWFYTIGDAWTSPRQERHCEFHKQFLDIQLILRGEEIIAYSLLDASHLPCYEKKTDLFIVSQASLNNFIHLTEGEFVTFYPGELHQASCMVDEPKKVRKAVFKVPIDII